MTWDLVMYMLLALVTLVYSLVTMIIELRNKVAENRKIRWNMENGLLGTSRRPYPYKKKRKKYLPSVLWFLFMNLYFDALIWSSIMVLLYSTLKYLDTVKGGM